MLQSRARAAARWAAPMLVLGVLLSAQAQDDMAPPPAEGSGQAEAAARAEVDAALEEAFRYEANWLALTDAGEHAKAVELTETWINDATVQFGEKSIATIAPLLRQAQSLHRISEPRRAVEAYRDAVKLIERNLGAFSPELVKPLTEMGQVLMEEREHEGAVSILMRAKDITHRNSGIFNLEQEPLIQLLTETYMREGEIRQATREQRLLFGTAERVYGEDSVEFVPALQRWAKWNARIQRYPDARRLFYQAVEILEKEYGPNDLRLVETLNLLAQSLYDNARSIYPREGAMALQRVIDIYEAQEFTDAADLLAARSRLADWYMYGNRTDKAIKLYAESIRKAKEDGVSDKVIEAQYGAHRLLRTSVTPIGSENAAVRERLSTQPAYMVIQFDIDKRGFARNIRIVEDTVNVISMARTLRERVKNSTFRPRFVDGQPAPTYGQKQYYLFDGSLRAPYRVNGIPAGVETEAQKAAREGGASSRAQRARDAENARRDQAESLSITND